MHFVYLEIQSQCDQHFFFIWGNNIKENGVHTDYLGYVNEVFTSQTVIWKYLHLYIKINACTFYHEHIIIPFHIVRENFNKKKHRTSTRMRVEYYSTQVYFYLLYYINAISLLITHWRNCILQTVKDTWFLETRTDVPMFSRSMTCSVTVPATHIKGTMSYRNLSNWIKSYAFESVYIQQQQSNFPTRIWKQAYKQQKFTK